MELRDISKPRSHAESNRAAHEAKPRPRIAGAIRAADSVIHSVDRVLRPDCEPPFVTTCGGLSRLRSTTN
ncbi:MAG: hypothetical protein QF733_07320 [Phycisphaerales bacterium]|nr:hypothetical protein [Phycisphaerales bacterium]